MRGLQGDKERLQEELSQAQSKLSVLVRTAGQVEDEDGEGGGDTEGEPTESVDFQHASVEAILMQKNRALQSQNTKFKVHPFLLSVCAWCLNCNAFASCSQVVCLPPSFPVSLPCP